MFDFPHYEQKANNMSIDELRFAIEDARQAATAMKGWNPDKEGHYEDEAHVYAIELRRRKSLYLILGD
jgi:hypothetical protein